MSEEQEVGMWEVGTKEAVERRVVVEIQVVVDGEARIAHREREERVASQVARLGTWGYGEVGFEQTASALKEQVTNLQQRQSLKRNSRRSRRLELVQKPVQDRERRM